MAKAKLRLCCMLCVVVFVGFVVANPHSSEASNTNNQNSCKADGLKLSLVLERLEILENKHQKLEKSHVELKERFKSLTKEVAEFKSENCVGEDVWLLTPPLRGRRGQKGEKGDSGILVAQLPIPSPIPSQSPPEKKPSSTTSAPQSISNPLTSCRDAMENLPSPRSNKQVIYPHGNNKSVEVLCDFQIDGGGWTIIQKRSSGPNQEFNQNWNEYEKGFGSLDKNFWLGLENIYALTKNRDQELRIELEDFEGEKRWAKYSRFSVSDASDFYRLSISGYSGNAGDGMISTYGSHLVLNGMQFTTKDKNNAKSSDCAVYGGGWWFNNCSPSKLNAVYREKGQAVLHQGIIWESWKGWSYSLAKTEMKIRTRK